MGDRGNIVVRQTSGTNRDDVWFYTHWSGSYMKEIIGKALALKQRWDDPSYLARIIFDKLTDGDKGTTGFGISTSIGDNEHPILVVETVAKLVYTVREDQLEDNRLPDGLTACPFTTYQRLIESVQLTTRQP